MPAADAQRTPPYSYRVLPGNESVLMKECLQRWAGNGIGSGGSAQAFTALHVLRVSPSAPPCVPMHTPLPHETDMYAHTQPHTHTHTHTHSHTSARTRSASLEIVAPLDPMMSAVHTCMQAQISNFKPLTNTMMSAEHTCHVQVFCVCQGQRPNNCKPQATHAHS